MSKKYVFDACSLIAYINDEQGAEVIENIIIEAIENNVSLMINKLNLFEVYYDTWRSKGRDVAANFLTDFQKLPVQLFDIITDQMIEEATRLKLSYKMSVADSFALATANIEGAKLITSDHHEFDSIESAGEASFFWIR